MPAQVCYYDPVNKIKTKTPDTTDDKCDHGYTCVHPVGAAARAVHGPAARSSCAMAWPLAAVITAVRWMVFIKCTCLEFKFSTFFNCFRSKFCGISHWMHGHLHRYKRAATRAIHHYTLITRHTASNSSVYPSDHAHTCIRRPDSAGHRRCWQPTCISSAPLRLATCPELSCDPAVAPGAAPDDPPPALFVVFFFLLFSASSSSSSSLCLRLLRLRSAWACLGDRHHDDVGR